MLREEVLERSLSLPDDHDQEMLEVPTGPSRRLQDLDFSDMDRHDTRLPVAGFIIRDAHISIMILVVGGLTLYPLYYLMV